MINIQDLEEIFEEVMILFNSPESVTYYTGLSNEDAEDYYDKLVKVYRSVCNDLPR